MGKKIKRGREVNSHTTELYDKITRIETEVIDKINLIKKTKPRNHDICGHLIHKEDCVPFSPTQDYYQMFWRTFFLNEIKRKKIQNIEEEVKDLEATIKWLQKKYDKYEKLVNYRKSKNPKNEGNLLYKCSFSGCNREYASLNSLTLHKQLKHKKQEYEKSKGEELRIKKQEKDQSK